MTDRLLFVLELALVLGAAALMGAFGFDLAANGFHPLSLFGLLLGAFVLAIWARLLTKQLSQAPAARMHLPDLRKARK